MYMEKVHEFEILKTNDINQAVQPWEKKYREMKKEFRNEKGRSEKLKRDKELQKI